MCNKDLNLNIKNISELCELCISLNFYAAQHTFATTITLANGISIALIKAMMGHSKIESTLQYARMDKSVLKKEMMSLQEKVDLIST